MLNRARVFKSRLYPRLKVHRTCGWGLWGQQMSPSLHRDLSKRQVKSHLYIQPIFV